MSEGMSRRDFLKTALSGAAGLVVGKEGSAWAKKLAEKSSEKKEIKLPHKGFLFEEIQQLSGLLEKPLQNQVRSEFQRIQEMENDKTLERRFSNSPKQIEKYFAPFLSQQKIIMKAIEKADPQKRVPREIILGVLGMEGGGRVTENPESRAAGHYQLTRETALALGLRVDQTVDQRYSLEHSTPVVMDYLKKLHEYFGRQWGLALMAYSGGPTKLEGRLREKFDLDEKEKFTPELFQSKVINAVTVYSKKFKHLGQYHSVQYPFGAQIMANLIKDLAEKKKI